MWVRVEVENVGIVVCEGVYGSLNGGRKGGSKF